MSAKLVELRTKLANLIVAIKTLESEMSADEAKQTDENKQSLLDKLAEAESLKAQILQIKQISDLDAFSNQPSDAPKAAGEQPSPDAILGRKSLGERFVDAEAYKNAKNSRPRGTVIAIEAKDVMKPSQVKATFDVATAGTTSYDRQAGIVLQEQQRLTVADLLAQAETTSPTIRYLREVSFTNAATIVAEGAAKPEASFDTEEVDAPVRKIAVTAKVTDELFADFAAMRDYVNNRLIFMVGTTEEAQLLNGDGVGNNLTGIMNVAGIQSQALGADTKPDAIHKAITKIRAVGFFEPDAMVIHPNDWQELRLLKDANNQYFGGGPFTGQYGVGGIASESFWGLRVVVTTAIAEGTCLVGAFRLGAQVFYRMGVMVEATNSNEDDFIKNKIAIRVEERLALAVYRPKAFCKVTGI